MVQSHIDSGMTKLFSFQRQRFIPVQPTGLFPFISLALMFIISGPAASADEVLLPPEEVVAERAKEVWESGSGARALEIIDEWLDRHDRAPVLNKLRGDILASSRRPQEAVQAYEAVLATTPAALDARWAKWSVLVRSGQEQEAVAELQRIAQLDAPNPLIHLRLAQELRRLDRLEESLESYKKAVERAPDLLSWRLALARARFDVLDYPGAYDDVQYVLHRIPPGSPLEAPARNLLATIYGDSKDRGRRFTRIFTPEGTEEQLKEWAAIRAEAWRLYVDERYAEAEPVYRKILALNPRDSTAAHQFGVALMKLGRCEEALEVFRTATNAELGDEEYADTVFRMGQCLVEREQWSDAFVHFQMLYDSAVAAEAANKDAALPPETRVLDKAKLARWLDKVRPHVPDADSMVSRDQSPAVAAPEEARHKQIAEEPLPPQMALDIRASLMGRDADFSWFRFVIPAAKVIRDDFPTGAHEFIPLNPSVSFPVSQQEIYLVFGLVSSSYDAVPLATQCFVERLEASGEQQAAAQDRVVMAMSDQSGFFKLSGPGSGWRPGLYRCGLFAGESASADTQVDEVRFRILETAQPVLRGS